MNLWFFLLLTYYQFETLLAIQSTFAMLKPTAWRSGNAIFDSSSHQRKLRRHKRYTLSQQDLKDMPLPMILSGLSDSDSCNNKFFANLGYTMVACSRKPSEEQTCILTRDLCNFTPDCPNGEDEDEHFCLFKRLEDAEIQYLRETLDKAAKARGKNIDFGADHFAYDASPTRNHATSAGESHHRTFETPHKIRTHHQKVDPDEEAPNRLFVDPSAHREHQLFMGSQKQQDHEPYEGMRHLLEEQDYDDLAETSPVDDDDFEEAQKNFMKQLEEAPIEYYEPEEGQEPGAGDDEEEEEDDILQMTRKRQKKVGSTDKASLPTKLHEGDPVAIQQTTFQSEKLEEDFRQEVNKLTQHRVRRLRSHHLHSR
ncbi:unnamed protein product [Caenorhabditis auriculariae]|uniref:Uncharacterized protein n=1 Tax=Caenorhabditis auriculariae TaxID=2777116 RepID=A0A8S1HDD3_9PELO|nr:unnamed protein product [Caenorhabditis auriculariae]